MIVLKKVASIFKHDVRNFEDKRPSLKGIKCIWFTSDGKLSVTINGVTKTFSPDA